MSRSAMRLAVLTLLVLGLALPAAAGANGGEPPRRVNSCGYTTEQTFAGFGDLAYYHMAPGGDAEANLGWKLTGGAHRGLGQGALGTGSRVFAMPQGSSITSPRFCITLDSPTMRFSVNDPGIPGARLRLEVLSSATGLPLALPISTIYSTGKPGVRLTPPCLLLANLTSLLRANGTTDIQFRFTADRGQWQVDDVYVDPYKRV